MMGDFDWDELSRQHRGSAFFWFCSYMVLVYLIMLNMLLAIVMDVYTGVKAKMSSKESDAVWTQTWIMMKGFYMKITNRDKTVSDERILEKLQGVVKIVPALDKKGLLELIPNLQPDQAQSPKSMALSNIPPIYRKMVNRVIQRELNIPPI